MLRLHTCSRCFAIWIALVASAVVATTALDDAYIQQKLTELATQQSDSAKEIQELKLQVHALDMIVAQQDLHIQKLETAMAIQEQELNTTQNNVATQNQDLIDITSHVFGTVPYNGSISRATRITSGIAFTMYLDHPITLGQYRIVKFNQMIINDGNYYNNYTGVFTCPMSGVYLFSFSIGERNVAGCQIKLVKNGANVVDGAVDTYHDSQDLQASTTTTLRCDMGDSVWVEAAGDHLEGSADLRLSSFTGVFLYE